MNIPALAALVFAIVGLLVIRGNWREYKGGSSMSPFDLFDGADETISEAMERAGRDGRPRTFVLKDGSRYSGRIHLGLSAELRGGATDIKPADVVKVEYPEG